MKPIFRAWLARKSQGVILLVHGLGGYSWRWSDFAEYFRRKNISSFALDLPGFGQTAGTRGDISSFKIYYQQIKQLHQIIQKKLPGQQIFLCGESLGGLISFNFSAHNPGLFSGLICLSPAFQDRLCFPIHDQINIYERLLTFSRQPIELPLKPESYTRDPVFQKKINRDPHEVTSASPQLLLQIRLTQLGSLSAAHKIQDPLLFLLPKNDLVINTAFSQQLFKLINSPKKIIIYPRMYHALSIDLNRQKIFQDSLNWVKSTITQGS